MGETLGVRLTGARNRLCVFFGPLADVPTTVNTCVSAGGVYPSGLSPRCPGADRYLRVTWHKDTSTVVFSHWQGDVCVSSTPVSLGDATKLIGLMVGALKEVALRPMETAASAPVSGGLFDRLRQRFKPGLAQVVKLHDRIRQDRSVRGSSGA